MGDRPGSARHWLLAPVAAALAIGSCAHPAARIAPKDAAERELITGAAIGATGPRYSPDGSRIAFTARLGGSPEVAIVPASGGAPLWVTRGGTNIHPAWSPDGRHLVYISHAGGAADLFVVESGGGEPARLTRSGAAKSGPDWSPDGRTIAYSSNEGGDWNIWIMPAAGGQARRLTTHPGDEWDPRYSPDGRSILFSTNWGENANIDTWMVPTQGGDPVRLTAGLEDEVTPAWSPDGRFLAYFTDLGGLFVLELATGKRTQLAPGEGFHDILSWSPDGRWIAAARDLEPFRLFQVALEGGEPRPLGLREFNLWTPDIAQSDGALAFAAMDRSGNGDLWIVRDRARPVRLTRDPAPDLHPAWSPSGDQIAFVSRRGGAQNGDIWVAARRGGGAIRLTTLRSAQRPRWCDERLILFQSDRVADGQHHIWAVAPGEAPRQLTHGRREVEPDCVPATRELLYAAPAAKGTELFRRPLSGGAAVQLTSAGASARFPRASPDGSLVAFVSNRDGSSEIYVMPMRGGPARRLTRDGGEKSPPSWSASGSRIVYSVKRGTRQIRRYAVPAKLVR